MSMRQKTGWKVPMTMVGNRTVAGSDVDWSNPDNAKGDDGIKATAVPGAGESTSGLAASNFGFSGIPTGSIITGIEVRIGDHTFSSAAGQWDDCRLILADNTDGTENKNTDMTTPTAVEVVDDVGGEFDMWSEAIAPADVEDVDFGFFVSFTALAGSGTVTVDFMQMRVWYQLATAWEFPATAVANRAITGGTVNWSFQDNIKADDGADAISAYVDTGILTNGLAASNFDFSAIPAGAVIDGIEVRVGDYAVAISGDDVDWTTVRLIRGDNTDGITSKHAQLADFTLSDQTDEAGGASDLWNEPGIDRAEVQDVDFGFFVGWTSQEPVGGIAAVDFMQMRISYHLGMPNILIANAAVPGYNPSHQSSDGAIYKLVFNEDGGVSRQLNMLKSTNPDTDPWTEQDAAGAPATASNVVPSVLSSVQNGDLIHIAWCDTNLYRYGRFNMATDNWDTTSQTIESVGANPPALKWISIGARSDDDAIVLYNGQTDGVKGDEKERVDANIRTGTTWGGPVALDAGGDVQYGNPSAVRSPLTDEMHALWQVQTATTDPPVQWESVAGRTIRPDDTLSSAVTGTPDTDLALLGMQMGVGYDNTDVSPARQEIQWIGAIEESGVTRRQLFLAVEDGGDDLSSITGVQNTDTEEQRIFGETGVISMAALANASNSSDIHLLYSGGGFKGADRNLYYTKSIDEGATWDTPMPEHVRLPFGFVELLSVNIYVRGPDTVLAYSYDEDGTQKYNEKVLIAGPRRPMFLERPKIGARYY